MMISLEEFLKIPKNELKGRVFVFPTDTVYGIGTWWDDFDAIKRIYDIKVRDAGKPLAVLISDFNQVKDKIVIKNDEVNMLMKKYWPGPLTLIFEKNDKFEYPFRTIGFRIPNSPIALKILNYLGPLATTSVNYSGEEPINNVDDINNLFGNKIDYIITDFAEFSKTSSTVIDVTSETFKTLRVGTIKI